MRALLLAWRAFGFERTHSSSFSSIFFRPSCWRSSCCEALLLLLEPGGVVALPRNAVAAVEFEDPLGDVVEEVAVVGHRDHGARDIPRGSARARPRIRHRGGWWAHPAAACRARTAAAGTAPRGASRRRRACRSWRPTRGRRSASAAISSLRSSSQPPAASMASCSFACSSSSAFISSSRHGLGELLADLVEARELARRLRRGLPSRPGAPCACRRAAAPAAGSRRGCRSAARASPSMLVSTPAMIFSSVDLPEPLRPSTPILAPGKKDREMSRRMVRLGGTTFETRFMV